MNGSFRRMNNGFVIFEEHAPRATSRLLRKALNVNSIRRNLDQVMTAGASGMLLEAIGLCNYPYIIDDADPNSVVVRSGNVSYAVEYRSPFVDLKISVRDGDIWRTMLDIEIREPTTEIFTQLVKLLR